MNKDREELQRLISALKRFNQFDTKMQVSTVLTFLEVAAATLDKRDISVQDLERSIGLLSGTASRNVYYWAEGHKDMTGGHMMMTVKISTVDRRRRDLTLNSKGRAFLDTVLGDMRHGPTKGEQVSS